MFRRFWAAAPGAPDLPSADRPVGAGDALGGHSPAADQLVLLIRGALLRRFPTAAVYLSGRAGRRHRTPPGPDHGRHAGRRDGVLRLPDHPRRGAAPRTGQPGSPRWSVVLQESVDHVRFGLDDAPGDGSTARRSTSWQDLDWANPHVAGHAHLPVAGPLAGLSRPLTAAARARSPCRTAIWGADAGQLAAALTRPAFRVRIPVALWLAPPASGTGA